MCIFRFAIDDRNTGIEAVFLFEQKFLMDLFLDRSALDRSANEIGHGCIFLDLFPQKGRQLPWRQD